MEDGISKTDAQVLLRLAPFLFWQDGGDDQPAWQARLDRHETSKLFRKVISFTTAGFAIGCLDNIMKCYLQDSWLQYHLASTKDPPPSLNIGAATIDRITVTQPERGLWFIRYALFQEYDLASLQAKYIMHEVDCIKRLRHPHFEVFGEMQSLVDAQFGNHFHILRSLNGLESLAALFYQDSPADETGSKLAGPLAAVVKRWFICLASAANFLHENRISHGSLDAYHIYYHDERIWISIEIDTLYDSTWEMCTSNNESQFEEYARLRISSTDVPELGFKPWEDVFNLGILFTQLLSHLVLMSDPTLAGQILNLKDPNNSDERTDKYNDRDVLALIYQSISCPGIKAYDLYMACFYHMLNPGIAFRTTMPTVLIILSVHLEEFLGPLKACDCSQEIESKHQAPDVGWQRDKERFLWDSSSDTPLTVGARGTLGQGRTGEVDEVMVPGFDIALARKRILITGTSNSRNKTKAAIRLEIENMRKLNHSHIVKVVGCYQQSAGLRSSHFYVLMYPVGDSDLRVFLEETCTDATPKEMAKYYGWISGWYSCLATALAYIHSHGIHHEDIKPANIIHCGKVILLTDFSSSRKIDSFQETSTESPAAASRLFAAPEALYHGDRVSRHGSQTDVYSLALVFVEMLTVQHGSSIESLRKTAFDSIEGPLQYHRVAHMFEPWFRDLSNMASYAYDNCFASMLLFERKTRPSAQRVADRLGEMERTSGDWDADAWCDCRYSRWEKPARSIPQNTNH